MENCFESVISYLFFSPSARIIIGSELRTDQTDPIWGWLRNAVDCHALTAWTVQPVLYYHRRLSSMPNPPHNHTIFEGGKLKPGLYKIQNLVSKTYVDIHEHNMEVCCRPASALEKDDGIVRTPLFPTFSLANPAFTVGSPPVRRRLYDSHGSSLFERFRRRPIYLRATVGPPRIRGETRSFLYRESGAGQRHPHLRHPLSSGMEYTGRGRRDI